MGAWGTGPFQNDDAGDWIIALEDGSSDDVSLALEVAAECEETLGIQASCCALAAAEVVSAARGYPCSGCPKEVQAWIQDRSFYADRRMTSDAKKAVRNLQGNSELAQEWEGHGGWTRRLQHLLLRLSKPSKIKSRPRAKLAKSNAPASRSTSQPDARTIFKQLKKMGASINKTKSGEIVGVDLSCSEKFNSEDLPILMGIATLSYLALNWPRYKQADIKLIAKLPQLKELSISSYEDPFNDIILKELAKISALEELRMDSVAEISDAGLLSLKALSNLKTLSIDIRSPTKRAVAALKKALPNCELIDVPPWYLR